MDLLYRTHTHTHTLPLPTTMTRILINILFVIVLLQLSQTHPMSLRRITRDIVDTSDTNVLVTTDADGRVHFIQMPKALVKERPRTFLINVAHPIAGDEEQLVQEETHVFRPLFTYRQNIAKRLRLKKDEDLDLEK